MCVYACIYAFSRFNETIKCDCTLNVHTHFELGFQLDSIGTLGRKAVEQHGEQSENL